MIFEGILIHKIPYKERDLIVKLLLRNGMTSSFYVYGGQGGGKFQKPTIFEIGSLIRLTIKDKKKRRGSDLIISSEHQNLWKPQKTRYNIKAYYLLCLYLEIVQKISVLNDDEFWEKDVSDYQGIFSALSNSIFYLEDALANDQFQVSQQLHFFLVKLLYHLGIMPDSTHCHFCQTELLQKEVVVFLPEAGQFSCGDCTVVDSLNNEKDFLMRIKFSYQTKHQDYIKLMGHQFSDCDKLLRYFCHHFHLKPIELKSYGLLFK